MAWKGFGAGGGGGVARGIEVNTGALVKNVSKSVAHGLTGCTGFLLSAFYDDNTIECAILEPNPAFPTTHFLIQVSVDFPAGVTVKVIGYP